MAALYIPAAQNTAGVSAQSGNIDLELLMPETYEQYLELENPSDFAVNDHYIAIADKPASGNARIYVYDRNDAAAGYRVYEHETDTNATLSSLQLYENGGKTHLYFVASGTQMFIHHIDLNAAGGYTAIPTSVSCASFLISGDYLYYSTVTSVITVARMDMQGFDFAGPEQTLTLPDGLTATNINPYFAQSYTAGDSDRIYFSANSAICSVTGDSLTATEEWSLSSSIRSFAVVGQEVYYSTTALQPPLFVYSNGDSTEIRRNGEEVVNVPSMRLIGDTLYLLCGKNLQTFDPASDPASRTFEEYEIGKYSVSDVRLGGAATISAYGGNLVIADQANRRVMVYSSRTQSYSYLRGLSYIPAAVCAGEDCFLVADNEANRLYIYRYEDFSPLLESPFALSGDMLDGAYSFGSFYLLTAGTQHGAVIGQTDSGYQITPASLSGTFSQIAADLLGNLYLMNGGAVYPVSEENFRTGTVGESLHSFGSDAIDLAVDYTGALCAVTPDALLTYKDRTPSTLPAETALAQLVYSQRKIEPASLVFDPITGDCYLLGDGFIATVQGLGLSSLCNLSAEGVYEDIFASSPAAGTAENGLLITAPAGTVAVTLDAATLEESTRALLDCGDYRRLDSERTGIVLSQQSYGTIVLFHQGDASVSPIRHDYEICLLLDTDAEMLHSGIDGSVTGNATVSNAVGVYRFPAMRIGTTASEGNTGNTYQVFGRITQLARGQKVTLLGYVSDQQGALDTDYYFVSYTSEGGQTAYGFVPAAYILGEGSGGVSGTQQISYRRLDRGESVTLSQYGDPSSTIELSNRELLKVYDDTLDSEGRVYVEYSEGNTLYVGWIYESQLYEATPAVIAVLVVVSVVAAAVILSVCYLLLRKQPTLQ